MTAVLPVGRGTAACRGPKYFLLCSYLPFGFVSVKFAPDTVEALVRLGTEVWTRLPRVVAMMQRRVVGQQRLLCLTRFCAFREPRRRRGSSVNVLEVAAMARDRRLGLRVAGNGAGGPPYTTRELAQNARRWRY